MIERLRKSRQFTNPLYSLFVWKDCSQIKLTKNLTYFLFLVKSMLNATFLELLLQALTEKMWELQRNDGYKCQIWVPATGFAGAQMSPNLIRRICRAFCIGDVIIFLIPDVRKRQAYVLQLPGKGSFADISFLNWNVVQSSNSCLKWSLLS